MLDCWSLVGGAYGGLHMVGQSRVVSGVAHEQQGLRT